jgi:hypothetical protein
MPRLEPSAFHQIAEIRAPPAQRELHGSLPASSPADRKGK